MQQNYLTKLNISVLFFFCSLLQAQSFKQSFKFVFPYVAYAFLFVVILVNIGLLMKGKKEKRLGIKYIIYTAIAVGVAVAFTTYIL